MKSGLICILVILMPITAFAVGKQLVGQKPPELQVKEWLNTEKNHTLADLQGKIVLIDFWATWCGPCVRVMPHIQKLWEEYKEKGLVVIALTAEDKKKVEPFIKQRKFSFLVALDDSRKTNKAYGIRSIPTTYIIAPDGKVAWQGHAGSKDIEKTITTLLPKVQKDKDTAEGADEKATTELKLKEDIVDRLKSAVKRAARGELSSALRLAERVLADEQAKDDEKEDAEYIKEEVEKLADKLFKQVDKLLKEKKPYEARQLLFKLRGAFSGTDYSTKAQDKMDEIDKDDNLKDELTAGEIYVKGLKYVSEEKNSTAIKMFKRIVDKYPETEYAKRAKEKLKSLEEEKDQ